MTAVRGQPYLPKQVEETPEKMLGGEQRFIFRHMRKIIRAIAVGIALSSAATRMAFGQAPLHSMHHDFLSTNDAQGRRVEYYWIAPEGRGPWPAIVFLHGHQDGLSTPGARQFVDYGVMDTMAARGYVAIAVSQPGYGHSDGPADFMGPRTVGAVALVIQHFRNESFVRGDRIGLEGVSRGAIVAGLVAAHDSTIRAMVLISGVYDFASPIDGSTAAGKRNIARRDQVRDAIAAETDGTVAALQARSALSMVDRIRTPALIINGEQDDRTDPEQAHALAERIRRNGVFARAVIYGEFGHAIPFETREREVEPFLEKYLK